MPTDEDKVLAALASAGAAGLTQTQVRRDVFHHHRNEQQIVELRDRLCAEELVECLEERKNGDRPALRWRVKASIHTRVQPHEGPPDGEGWVRWKDVLYIAEAGVPRGFALRQGKKVTARWQSRYKARAEGRVVRNDEQRGIRYVAHNALRRAVAGGFIERQGDWARLLRDPVVSQRPWMEAAYSILGRVHPTLTGEFIPKPPKTLVSVKEAELGRKLLPDEFLRRKPGKGGSWDPEDIEVRVRLPYTSSAAEMEGFIADYHARVAEAPRIQAPKTFEVNLPKNRRQP